MTLSNLITSTVSAAALIGALCTASIASADDRSPDNTAQNNDNSKEGRRPTADQAKNDKSDIHIAAKIRRSVVSDKALSTSAHNVKIVVEDGFVTLKGPVKSNAEKLSVEKKANEVAGAKNVRNEIEVAP